MNDKIEESLHEFICIKTCPLNAYKYRLDTARVNQGLGSVIGLEDDRLRVLVLG